MPLSKILVHNECPVSVISDLKMEIVSLDVSEKIIFPLFAFSLLEAELIFTFPVNLVEPLFSSSASHLK